MTAPEGTGRVVRGFTVYEDGTIVGRRGRVLKPCVRGGGYLYVGRWEAGRKVDEGVHSLVCEAFHGPPPADKPIALHRDGNPLSNRAENLYWGDHRENYADSVRQGTNYVPAGERHGNAKLTSPQVDAIRSAYADGGVTQAELGRRYGVSQQQISYIVRGTKWKD